jgi:hypothetical protein
MRLLFTNDALELMINDPEFSDDFGFLMDKDQRKGDFFEEMEKDRKITERIVAEVNKRCGHDSFVAASPIQIFHFIEKKRKDRDDDIVRKEFEEISDFVRDILSRDIDAADYFLQLSYINDPVFKPVYRRDPDPVGTVLFQARYEPECKSNLADRISQAGNIGLERSAAIVDTVIKAMKLGIVNFLDELNLEQTVRSRKEAAEAAREK